LKQYSTHPRLTFPKFFGEIFPNGKYTVSIYFPIHPVIIAEASRIAREIALAEVSQRIGPHEARYRMVQLAIRLTDALEMAAEMRRMFG
jgi:hypothetical protein